MISTTGFTKLDGEVLSKESRHAGSLSHAVSLSFKANWIWVVGLADRSQGAHFRQICPLRRSGLQDTEKIAGNCRGQPAAQRLQPERPGLQPQRPTRSAAFCGACAGRVPKMSKVRESVASVKKIVKHLERPNAWRNTVKKRKTAMWATRVAPTARSVPVGELGGDTITTDSRVSKSPLFAKQMHTWHTLCQPKGAEQCPILSGSRVRLRTWQWPYVRVHAS